MPRIRLIKRLKNENELTEQTKSDIAYAFQDAVVDTLAIKCKRALKETGYKRLVIAGGVSANKKTPRNPCALNDKFRW